MQHDTDSTTALETYVCMCVFVFVRCLLLLFGL